MGPQVSPLRMANTHADSVLGRDVPSSTPRAFSEPGRRGEIHLLGHRCRDCSARFFPRRMSCIRCFGHNLDAVELHRIGKVLSFAIVRQAPSGYFGPVPYAIGNVALDDGVIVLSPLTGKSVEAWRCGDVVAAYALGVPTREVDRSVTCYGFRPADPDDMSGARGPREAP